MLTGVAPAADSPATTTVAALPTNPAPNDDANDTASRWVNPTYGRGPERRYVDVVGLHFATAQSVPHRRLDDADRRRRRRKRALNMHGNFRGRARGQIDHVLNSLVQVAGPFWVLGDAA